MTESSGLTEARDEALAVRDLYEILEQRFNGKTIRPGPELDNHAHPPSRKNGPTMNTSAHLHAADDPELVRVPEVTYVAILGSGAPGTDDFYRKKTLIGQTASRLGGGEVPVIEIQYWYPEGSEAVEIADFYSVNPVPSLQYRVLAAIPDATTAQHLAAARASAADARATDTVELFTLPEQEIVQVMHHGPFAEEYATLERLGAFARDRGLHRSGPHHELHLDGFTRATPQDTLRTILRDPVT